MASRTNHLVFRDLHPAAESAGLSGLRPNVELSYQFLLGGRRAAPAARRARVDHAPGDQGQKREKPDRIDAFRQNDHRADNRADDKAELNRTAEHGSNRRVQVLLHPERGHDHQGGKPQSECRDQRQSHDRQRH